MKKELTIISLGTILILSACTQSVQPDSGKNTLPAPANSVTDNASVQKTTPATSVTATTSTPAVATAVPTKSSAYKIFLIALEDNGKSGKLIGCGDSVIAVDGQPGDQLNAQSGTAEKMQAAYRELLSIKTKNYGQSGLQNFLADSSLTLDSLTVKDGQATVALKGTLALAGECDNPRVESQLQETAMQFPDISQAAISINGKALKDLMSLKG